MYKLAENLVVEGMHSVPFRNLRKIAQSTLLKTLVHAGKSLLTINNNPIPLMTSLDDENAKKNILLFRSLVRANGCFLIRS